MVTLMGLDAGFSYFLSVSSLESGLDSAVSRANLISSLARVTIRFVPVPFDDVLGIY